MFVLGTAGHIDHGKSTLIHKLTGIDPDRLREEKERGMTIDLGFAWLKLPGGQEVGIIDVPGHERFIKNMLAGVGSIDLVMLVVAANEGVMPQTREHLAIIDLLRIKRGIVVINKKDLVDDELLSLVKMEVEELVRFTVLQDAPVVAISAVSGDGIETLIAAISDLLKTAEAKRDTGRPRLLIDRIFTIAGSGTVVTGTLVDGSLSVGQEVEIVPAGLKTRLRGLQTHKTRVEAIGPGNRVAANLVGVAPAQLERGNVLTVPGWMIPTDRVDVRLEMLKDARFPLKHGAEVNFYCEAAETMAKVYLLEGMEVRPGGKVWAQLVLDMPVALVKGDRFIIRSPMDTIGGGIIVISHAQRYRRQKAAITGTLEALENGSIEEVILATLEMKQPVEINALEIQCNLTPSEVKRGVDKLVVQGEIIVLEQGGQELLITRTGWDSIIKKAQSAVSSYHRKFTARTSMPKSELASKLGLPANSVILHKFLSERILVEDGAGVRLPAYEVKLTKEQQTRVEAYLRSLEQNPYSPSGDITLEPDVLKLLIGQGKVVAVGDGIVFSRSAYDDMVARILAHGREEGKIALSEVRDMFNSSRKYILPLLEHMDEKKLTKRVGDERVVR